MAKLNTKRFWAAIFLASTALSSEAGPDSDPVTSYSQNSTVMNLLLPQPGTDTSSAYGYLKTGDNLQGGLRGGKRGLKVSGVTRFLSIYRSMGESYGDMINSDKNFSFSDYPQANIGGSALGGYPVLELNLASQIASGFMFNVGYSMSHNFTGNISDGNAQNMSVIQNLNFRAAFRNDMVKTNIYAGEILATNLSKFTMGQPLYRDNFFERLPWDWYRNSFTRFQEYYNLSSNIGGQFVNRTPIQGIIAESEWLPMQINFKAVYGRSNFTSLNSHIGRGFPSILQGYRVEKTIFERQVRGYVGMNFYQRNAKVDFTDPRNDNNSIGSLDYDLKTKWVKVSGEFALGYIDNPMVGIYGNGFADLGEGYGAGSNVKLEFDQRTVLWPFSVEYYQIGQNLASVDGSIINSNHTVKQGGFGNTLQWDATLFTNMAAEVGQYANNRRGVNLQFEATLADNLKAQFGYSTSQELVAHHDTITIQHRVNAFSRSRFRPWFQAGGPYGRIKSVWLRTFETITLGNQFHDFRDENGERDLLGFTASELLLKFKDKLFGKEIVLLNFSSLNTVNSVFNFFPTLGDDNLIALWYNDFTAAYKLTKKLSVVGNFAIQGVQGSTKVDLSPDAPDVTDFNDEEQADKRVISSIGTMSAIGFDYDFNAYSGIHLRTKYMTHRDNNFVNDVFNGFETTLELKIFF